MEFWKRAVGYENLYEVSTLGNIRSISRNYISSVGHKRFVRGKVLKTNLDKYGYEKVVLRKNGKKFNHTMHRLVALTFIPNSENKPHINHINEIKTDNRIENLEWCTAKENNEHRDGQKRRGETNKNGKLSKPVLQLTISGDLVKEWPSIKEAKRNGFCKSGIIQ